MKRMKTVTSVMTAVLPVLLLAGCGGDHHGRDHGMSAGYGEPGMAKGHGAYREGSAERAIPEVKALIERHVKDPNKAQQVQTVLQEIIAEVKSSKQQARGYHEQLSALNARYEATPEEFTKVLDELNNSRMQSSAKILALRFKIKEMLTADEWKALTDEMSKIRGRYMHGA